VFHYTLRLLVSSLRLAPAGLARRFAPGETLLRSGGTRPPLARDDFFTSSERTLLYCRFYARALRLIRSAQSSEGESLRLRD
ncbi:MAG: hypothetical protein ACREYE_23150, partial [Gammaproteobacteria bacterium]